MLQHRVQPGPIPPRDQWILNEVLAGWPWAQRPVGVVAMPSRSHPQLVESVAAQIAQIGRLPLLGTLDLVDGGPIGAWQALAARLDALPADQRELDLLVGVVPDPIDIVFVNAAKSRAGIGERFDKLLTVIFDAIDYRGDGTITFKLEA